MDAADTWVLEWHEGCAHFHVQRLADAVASNRRAFVEGRAPAWVPIACGTQDEVGAFADALRPTLLAAPPRRPCRREAPLPPPPQAGAVGAAAGGPPGLAR